MNLHVKVKLDRNLCIACMLCVKYCPTNVFVVEDKEIKVHEERCIYCRSCEVLCPKKAIKTELLDEDLMIEVHKVL